MHDDVHPDEIAAMRAVRAEEEPPVEVDQDAVDADLHHRRVLRTEARKLVDGLPVLFREMDAKTVPVAGFPVIGPPEMPMTPAQVMAYRLGQRSVVEWVAGLAQEEDDG